MPPASPSPPEPTDEALLARAAAGEMAPFDLLVTRWQDRVLAYAWRMLGDRHAAEDAAQQAFINILQQAGHFAGRARFATYLYRTTHNLCLNQRRWRRRHPAASLDGAVILTPQGQLPLSDALSEDAPGPAAAADLAERAARVREAVTSLPAKYRQVVILRIDDRMPFARIAEIAGVNENTVKSRFRYALEQLADMLGEA
jgi:RNA polymerase sigma-70 factor (ECF subfamily)